MWVLLEFYNQYDQYGGYFAGVFATKEDAEASVGHVGRRGAENIWYEIKWYEIGKVYDEDDREV